MYVTISIDKDKNKESLGGIMKKIIKVEIEGLSYGGKAVGRYIEQGKLISVFVPYGAPGDIVEASIKKSYNRYWDGKIEKIVKQGSSRRNPVCSYFGTCGGCHFLHVSDKEQQKQKEKILAHILKDFDFTMKEMLIASPLNYRGRGTFQGEIKQGNIHLGLFEEKSHAIVDIELCPLMDQSINFALAEFRKRCSKKKLPDGTFRLEIIMDQLTKEAHYVLYLAELGSWKMIDLPNLTLILGKKIVRRGKKMIHLFLPRENMVYNPPQFTQVNPEINRRLIMQIMDKAKLSGKEDLLDLFCGMGNFSFPLSRDARSVVGVEASIESIVTARMHAEKSENNTIEFVNSDAFFHVKKLVSAGKTFHTIILDPPRLGVGKEIEYLAKLEPKQIFYISCQPRTLAKDLRFLLAKGYKIKTVMPIEMFPQTYHVETLVHIVKI